MMAEAMHLNQQDIPAELAKYCHYLLSVTNASLRNCLAWRLDPEKNSCAPKTFLLQDFRGFAEALGFTMTDIANFARKISPTMEIIQQWETQNASLTIGHLLNALCEIGRYDILNDAQFQQLIERDVQNFESRIAKQCNPVQVDEVDSTSDNPLESLTIGEADTGVVEHFDAYICSTVADLGFVQEMIYHLEQIHNLKLFIAERDLLPGCSSYDNLATLIKSRCRKMIIVLSPDYLLSEECKFATRFAFSLHPGADKRTLIPVMYRRCHIPDILRFITLLDFTRTDILQWFWPRLASSLRPQPTAIHSRHNIVTVPPSPLPTASVPTQPATAPVFSSMSVVVSSRPSFVTAPTGMCQPTAQTLMVCSSGSSKDESDNEMVAWSTTPNAASSVSTTMMATVHPVECTVDINSQQPQPNQTSVSVQPADTKSIRNTVLSFISKKHRAK